MNCRFLCKVLSARFPRPLEELRWAERTCWDIQDILLHHTDNLGFWLFIQRRSRSRSVVLRQSSLVEGLTRLLSFGRRDGDICSFHATEVLLGKLSKLLVAEVEHGGLFQEKVAM